MKIYKATLGAGEPVVLLHGWGLHSGIWQTFAADLAKNYHVILVDLPGFGRSTLLPTHYDLPHLCQMILDVAPPQANYLGWSWGGLLATAIAAYHPSRVKKLITVASSPCFMAQAEWPGIAANVFAQFTENLLLDEMQTLRRFLLLQLRYKSQIAKTFYQQKPQSAALQSGLAILQQSDLRQQVKQLSCPQQHIFGGLDHLIPVATAAKMTELAPQAEIVVIPEAAHVPFLSHTREVISHAKQFLETPA